MIAGRLPIGTHTIVATATDYVGNAATCSLRIIVRDAQPPTITCPASLTTTVLQPGTSRVCCLISSGRVVPIVPCFSLVEQPHHIRQQRRHGCFDFGGRRPNHHRHPQRPIRHRLQAGCQHYYLSSSRPVWQHKDLQLYRHGARRHQAHYHLPQRERGYATSRARGHLWCDGQRQLR